MALVSRLRILSLTINRRYFSTVLSPDSETSLSAKEKTRAAISLLKSENNPEKIVEICKAAAYPTPETNLNRIAFSIAITKLSESNSFSYIQQLLDDLRCSRPDLRSSESFAAHAIVLYGQAKMINHAIRTFKEFHTDIVGSGTGSVKAFNALLFACYLANNSVQVNRIFLEFPKLYNIFPNWDTYNTVIKAFCESGNSSSVYSVLTEMDRKGVTPNESAFGTLLAGFYKEDKYEDVAKVLEIMSEKYGISEGLTTYNIRIESLCKLKRSSEAKSLLYGMLSRGMKPNSITYRHLIHGFCNQGDLGEAKRLFKSMVNHGCEPDSGCYFILVQYLCKSGDIETAFEISRESIGKGWVPNFSTMKTVVSGLACIGKVQEAKELVGQMKEKFKKNVNLWDEIEAGLLR